jgi:hypothetical protein
MLSTFHSAVGKQGDGRLLISTVQYITRRKAAQKGLVSATVSPFPSTQDVRHLPHYPMSSNFETLFKAALAKYTKQTGKDLRDHPLADRIDSCDSPDSMLDIFKEQAQAFDEFRKDDTTLLKWLKPVVNVLHALSTNAVLTNSSSLVSSATFLIIHHVYLNTLYPGVSSRKGGFLRHRNPSIRAYLLRFLRPTPPHIWDLQEAKYAGESYGALVEIFRCIENVIRRLSIYTEIPPTPAMTEMVIKIIAELLHVFALATKQINQGRFSMSVLAYNRPWLTCVREIRKEIFRRKGHRISAAKAR